MEEENWNILTTDEQSEIVTGSIKREDAHYKYYTQVLIDNEVLVFHTFPKEKKKRLKKK